MIWIERKSVFASICMALFCASSSLCAENAVSQKLNPRVDGETLWFDCKEIGVEGKGWTDTLAFYDRLPAKAQGKTSAGVWDLSHCSTGLCVRFTTDASSIQVRWMLLNGVTPMFHMPATGASGLDLYVKGTGGHWRFVANGRPSDMTSMATFAVSPGEQYLLYLPLYNGVKLVEIGIPKGRTISSSAALAEHRKPIVFYGTSITQGGCASRPGMAWTAIVGRQLDTPVINLGFSGCGKMEPEMGDLLAELDPSVYVLDCLWNMSPDEVANRVVPFVKRLRNSHPNTPILFAEDCSFRNECPTEKGRVLRQVLQKLGAEGVKNVFFLPSQGMLGEDSEGTVDGCHPTDLGMFRMAESFTKSLRPLLSASPK